MPVTSRRGGGPAFPQLGGEAERYRVMDRHGNPGLNERGNPAFALRFGGNPDFKVPAVRRAAASNFAHSIESAPASTVASGMQWYPRVNEAVRKGVSKRGFMSGAPDKMLSGAGVVAAVSPNMDWDSNNIGAFKELQSLKPHHWDTIMSADARGTSPTALRSRLAAQDVVRGMSVSATSVANLQKAGRIIRGEHPDEVLNRRGAPKTNSFMHNIADPSDHRYVTVDGRAFDTLTNRARPWEYGRGISSANIAKGTSRYEDSAGVIQSVASGFNMHPSAAQAVSWEHVKYNIEQLGGQRKQGPSRVGQPYFDPHTGVPALHGRRK